VDYWIVLRGQIRVGLADLRRSSPTYLRTQTLEMGETHTLGLFIPAGVAHGFLALTDSSLLYVVDHYYDGGQDEHGVAWDDPDLCIEWGNCIAPVLSPRDAANLRLKDMAAERLPE
jgi:dTDP-4-dehydrorhamnose 3,5-epimerase